MAKQSRSQPGLQEDGRGGSRGSSRHEDRHYHSDVENLLEERQRNGRMASELLQEERDQEEQREQAGRKKPALVRSKTFDHSLLTQVQTDSDSKIERKKSHYSQISKSNCQYHKIFKEISKEEQLRQTYTCALQKDILYQGRMFVSDHWICFHSKVFGKDTKIAIPVVSVINIKKTKTAILVPNALVVATANDRYMFVSLLSRDNTYKFLMSMCLHLEEKSPCSSPVPSSADSSFRAQRTLHSPTFPRGEFSGLDGSVKQRREELEESSSSDSQAPDYDKMAEFPVPPFLEALKHQDSVSTQENMKHQHKAKTQHSKQQSSDGKQHDARHVELDPRTPRSVSLNTLLFIYMFLVCVLVLSSCYLAFRIISLEQRLTTLSSIDVSSQDDVLRTAEVDAELLSELLTINLMKLEKVQRNLQRLLEDTA
ncbi:GRAM domain-containing protein 2B [Salarias fasciatus]|uniref:GRAM domain-containing protein 2B n=1 Tax=Salarias fasciatus TaxID=181472 RepID=UPI001176E5A3|nr:GRAM domain-containing protein 2B-like [Salarias fasciatus]